MKTILIIIIALHGLIHLMGFTKAFGLAEIKELNLPISKPFGLAWLVAFALFTCGAILYFLKPNQWFWWAFSGVSISQVLIFFFWQDAKFGTIANAIILVAATMSYGSWSFEKKYHKDVNKSLAHHIDLTTKTISEKDLLHLPPPVKRYLKLVGVVGKPVINNVKIVFTGEMREKGKDWFTFTSEQHNFFEKPKRFFFMKANIKGLPTNGYHYYNKEETGMMVKILSLFPVVDLKGNDLFKAETVTFLNDLCLFSPGALIDKRINWKALDDFSAQVYFNNHGVQISAVLYFNKKGELINFISDDRTALIEGKLKSYRFSTPLGKYNNYNGYYLPSYGEAVWHFPEGEFAYGKFNLKNIAYNISENQL